MPPFCRRRTMTFVTAVIVVGLTSAGVLMRGTIAAPDTQEGAHDGKDKFKPLVPGGQIEIDGTKPQSKSEEATDQLLIALKSEETVQDGTTTWGDGGQEFVSPRYVQKNFLTIKSKADDITIKDILVDRGNCTAWAFGLPAQIKFGQAYKIYVMCDPLEAVINTDRGSYSFSWDQ